MRHRSVLPSTGWFGTAPSGAVRRGDKAVAPLTGSACVYRGVGGDRALHVQDNETVKVTSPHDDPVTHGTLRIKGRFGYQHVQNRG